MNIFKKTKQTDITERRRRPSEDTGYRTTQAFSYHSKRTYDEDNTGRGRTDRLESDAELPTASSRIFRSKIAVTALFGLFVFVVGSLTFLSPISDVVISDNAVQQTFLQDSQLYQQTAERELSSTLLNKSKITADTGAVSASLLKSHPELKSAPVVLPIFSVKPKIYVQAYEPVFILATRDSNAYLIDQTGRALSTINQVPNVARMNLVTVEDQTSTTVQIGSRAVPRTTVSFTLTVLAALKSQNIKPASFVLPASTHELDLYIEDKRYFVKMNLREDALRQSGTLLATLKRLETDRTVPAQYIDVRVPERVYYK